MIVAARWALALVLALAALPAWSHDGRPGWLQIAENAPGSWEVDLREPLRPGAAPALQTRLPAVCADATPPRATRFDGLHHEQRVVSCALAGAAIGVDGLDRAEVEVIVRVVPLDAPPTTARLTARAPTLEVPTTPSASGVAGAYLVLGVEHILLGLDHLLFVLALVLIVRGTRRLIEAITAFTIAHSVTLGAATLGWFHLPIAPVEAVIALSIVFLAAEIVHGQDGRPGLAARRTWLVALCFGLLHGLGFASALEEVGLPRDAIPAALLFFNLGVEVGQLGFVAVALPGLALARRLPIATDPRARRIVPYALGTIASFWLIERVAAFWA